MSIGSVLAGAGAGAFTGSRFGTPGTVVGAVVGGLLGFFQRPRAESGTSVPAVTSQIVAAVEPWRWIVGRARVAGAVAYAFTSPGIRSGQRLSVPDATLTFVLALSEGAVDGIERVWIDGEAVDLRSVTLDDGDEVLVPASGVYRDFVMVYPYLAADGTQGRALWGAPGSQWTPAHRLEGVSWVAVQVQQGSQKRDEGGERVFVRRATASGVVDEPVWIGPRFRQVPKFEFLVRGLRLTWPGQATPVWTDETVPILRHALTAVPDRPVAEAELDATSFAAARAHGAASLDTPAGSERRWTANGVIRATDRWQSVLQQLGWTMQGGAPEVRGRRHFVGGAPIAGVPPLLDETVILGIESAAVSTTLADRVNCLGCGVPQSAAHDWQRDTVSYADESLRTADGLELSRDLGDRTFVARPYTAIRLLAQAVRQLNLPSWQVSVRPGLDTYRICQFGSVVRLKDPAWGLTAAVSARIVAVALEPDWSLSLFCVKEEPDTFSDFIGSRLLPVAGDNVELLSAHSWGGDRPWAGSRYGLVEWRYGWSGWMLVPDPVAPALTRQNRVWDGTLADGTFRWPFGPGLSGRRWKSPEIAQAGAGWVRVDAEWRAPGGIPRAQIKTPAAGHCLVDMHDGTAWGASRQIPFGGWAALPDGTALVRVTIGWDPSPGNKARNVALTGAVVSLGRTRPDSTIGPGDPDDYDDHLRDVLGPV